MGKFVLEIGLVAGEEHLCNSCVLLNWVSGRCMANLRLEIYREGKGERWYFKRPAECPLTAVVQWPSEAFVRNQNG